MIKNFGIIKDKNNVAKRLLKYGLFSDKLPPCFNSEEFGDFAYKILINNSDDTKLGKGAFNFINFPLIQKNNDIRIMGIPHIISYFNLVKVLFDNWNNLYDYFLENWNKYNPNGLKMRKGKKKIFSLDDYIGITLYNTIEEKDLYKIKNGNKTMLYKNSLMPGNNYKVHLDISKFFHSIYSHSIVWAIRGKEIAQSERHSHWSDDIDKAITDTKNTETIGLPIGPQTSIILSEIILSKIDSILTQDFNYIRYIDDYTVFSKTKEEYENFINKLTEELYKYRLSLNSDKTKIDILPKNIEEIWISQLDKYQLPSKILENKFYKYLIYYFDFLTELSTKEDGRVLKYGLDYLYKKYKNPNCINKYAKTLIYNHFFTTIYHYPYLISKLEVLQSNIKLDEYNIKNNLKNFLKENIKKHQYDIITWILYYFLKNKTYKLNKTDYTERSKLIITDCLSLTLLFYKLLQQNLDTTLIVDYFLTIDEEHRDEYWLLEYELFLNNKINEDSISQKSLTGYKRLKDKNISFIKV